MTEQTETLRDKVIRLEDADTRVTNALLLAQAMGLDMTDPIEARKVLRHLRSVEQWVTSDVDE